VACMILRQRELLVRVFRILTFLHVHSTRSTFCLVA
jgi:hypothetical protein